MLQFRLENGAQVVDASEWVNHLSAYREAILSGVEIIEKQIRDGNLIEVHQAAKFLKISSLQVGIENMAELYGNLERFSRSLDFASNSDLTRALELIRAEIPVVEQQINTVIAWGEDN